MQRAWVQPLTGELRCPHVVSGAGKKVKNKKQTEKPVDWVSLAFSHMGEQPWQGGDGLSWSDKGIKHFWRDSKSRSADCLVRILYLADLQPRASISLFLSSKPKIPSLIYYIKNLKHCL